MSDTVTPLRSGITIEQTDKQKMLEYIAQVFDEMQADNKTPVCMVFSLVGELGQCRSGYLTGDSVNECNTLHISRGVMSLNVDYQAWETASNASDL